MSGNFAVAGIQARMSSTRLPGKMLADVGGAPMIQRVYERACRARCVDRVVVLTSTHPSDDPLAAELERRSIPYRRGSLEDVYSRYLEAAGHFDASYIVRITGDCPLIEPRVIDAQLEALARFDGDFVWVAPPSVEGTLAGQGAFSARALLAARGSEDARDREHVASFFFERERDRFRHVELVVDDTYRRDSVRLCVDEEPDLQLVRAVYEEFAPGGRAPSFGLDEVLAWLDGRDEVQNLNRDVVESRDNSELRRAASHWTPDCVGRWVLETLGKREAA